MDKFNYLQPLNDDNDLLAAEILLADDFPTYDVSIKQIVSIVADFSPNIAAILFHTVLSPPEPKLKQQQPNVQDEAADISRFPVISNEDIEELKSVAVNKNTSCSTKQYMNEF